MTKPHDEPDDAKAQPSKAVDRTPGTWKGRVTIAPDFDAPLPPDILAAFEHDAS